MIASLFGWSVRYSIGIRGTHPNTRLKADPAHGPRPVRRPHNDRASRGEAVYYSRSRQELWHKGATSGHVQKVVEMRVDCDQDAIWLRVDTGGKGSCHVGYRSCFYRSVPIGEAGAALRYEEDEKVFDPKAVYGHGTGDKL